MSGVFGPENVPAGQSVDFKKSATRLALSFAGTLWSNPGLEIRIRNKTRTSRSVSAAAQTLGLRRLEGALKCAGSRALWSAPARRRFGVRRLDGALECAGSRALWSAPARRRF